MTVSKSNVHLRLPLLLNLKKTQDALDGGSKELKCGYIKSLKMYQANHPSKCFLPARLSPRFSDIWDFWKIAYLLKFIQTLGLLGNLSRSLRKFKLMIKCTYIIPYAL